MSDTSDGKSAKPKPVDGISQAEFVAWLRGEVQAIGAEYRRVLAKEVAEIAPSDPDQGNLFKVKRNEQSS